MNHIFLLVCLLKSFQLMYAIFREALLLPFKLIFTNLMNPTNKPQYRRVPDKISLNSARSVEKRLIVFSPKKVNLRIAKNIRHASSDKAHIFPIFWRN